MAKVRVAFGWPRRDISDAALLKLLAELAWHFTEQPARMQCRVRRLTDVTWGAFEATSIGADRVLAAGFFTDVMCELLRVPSWIEIHERGGDYELSHYRNGKHSFSIRSWDSELLVAGRLPDGAALEGDAVGIGLRALGLTLSDPFVELAGAREVVPMRVDRLPVAKPKFEAGARPLPVGVNPGVPIADEPLDRGSTPAVLEARVAALLIKGAAAHMSAFDREKEGWAAELAALGAPAAASLAAQMGAGELGVRAAVLAYAALGRLGGDLAARAVLPGIAKRSTRLYPAAYHALAAMGEAARPALAEASLAKSMLPREPAAALLKLLDSPKVAPLREVRRLRDALEVAGETPSEQPQGAAELAYALRRLIETKGGADDHDLKRLFTAAASDPLAPFGVVLVCVEHCLPDFKAHQRPNMNRRTLVRVAREVFSNRMNAANFALGLLPK